MELDGLIIGAIVVRQNARVAALVTLVDIHDLELALVVLDLQLVLAQIRIEMLVVLQPAPFGVGVVARLEYAN